MKITKINPAMIHIPFNPTLKERARELRNNMTLAEKKIWYELLSKNKMSGLRFLRQKPINNFIVDFYCSKLLLVIEIDGESHFSDEAMKYDKERTEILNSYGLEVIRYTNDAVLQSVERVVADLQEKIIARKIELYGLTEDEIMIVDGLPKAEI